MEEVKFSLAEDKLEKYFEEIVNTVEEFKDLRNYNIKVKKTGISGWVRSARTPGESPNFSFTAGNSFGYFITAILPVLMGRYLFLYTKLYALILTGVFIYVLLMIYFLSGEKKTDKGLENSDPDFIIFTSSETNLAHELGHISLHFLPKEKTTEISNIGFRNGLKFFFINVKWDIEVEELLSKYNINNLGRIHILFLNYFNIIGKSFRFLKVI